MKINLIKKATLCALSVSCLAALASCSFGGSTTKVFANKDIQAYAKKYDINYDNVKDIKLYEYKESEKESKGDSFTYTLLQDKTSEKYQLYMKYANRIYDIPTDESETVTEVTSTTDLYNSYGYFIISFSTGKKMAVDYKGQTLVEKDDYYSLKINYKNSRIIDNTGFGGEKNKLNLYTGEKTFYDFVELETSEGASTDVYEIKAVFEKGLVTDFTRTKLSSAANIDYNPIVDNNTFTARLKKYDLYLQNDSAYVKDTKGKLVSSFALNKPTTYYVLDDTLFYQSSKSVTINDDYTYISGSNFYALKTYKVDLLSGKTTEIKDYKYLLSNTRVVKGLNEKEDRAYNAAIYATLTKIEDKKLDLQTTTAMIDKNGKILSSKIGEKGYAFRYFDDKTYILSDGSYLSVINSKGKVKGTFLSSDYLAVNLYSKQLFVVDNNDLGYYVDNNLKITCDPTTLPYEILYTLKNGNVVLEHYGEILLASVTNGEIKVIEKYEEFDSYIQLYPDLTEDLVKHIIVNDSLRFYNIYLVEYESNDKYTIEIHSVDGSVLKTITDVKSINYNGDSVFTIVVETEDEVYHFGVNYINAKTYDSGMN